MRERIDRPGKRGRLLWVAAAWVVCTSPLPARALFIYDPVVDPILSATFSIDAAEWTAHRTVFGFEVNEAFLVDVTGHGLGMLDLSDDLFGSTDLLFDPALVDQAATETGLVSVPVDPSFFPALEDGAVGLWFTFTDTADGLFAMDTLVLSIVTASDTTIAYFGAPVGNENDGYGLGLADGASLPSPLPGSLSVTGTGFDEAIASKSHHDVPEPRWIVLASVAVLAFLHRRP